MNKYESRSEEVVKILSIHGGMHIIPREEYWDKTFYMFGMSKEDLITMFQNLQDSMLNGIHFQVGKLFDEGDKAKFKLNVFGHGDYQYDHFSTYIKND